MTKRSLVLRTVALQLLLLGLASMAAARDRVAVFDEVAGMLEEQFHDPGMAGLDWARVTAEHRARIAPDMDREAFAAEVNGMLSRLQTSHTWLYTPDDPAWYQLAGVFMPAIPELAAELGPHLSNGAPAYVGIGVMTEQRAEGYFVTGVLHGHPAERAGVLVGDRLVAVEDAPFHPIRSFLGREGEEIAVAIERRPGERLTLTATPAVLDGRTMFADAMRASVRVIEHPEARIGYVRVWSYAGQVYQDILTRALLYGGLKDADALVLDLRGGWGGASPVYLNLFTDQAMTFTSIRRDGTAVTFGSGWAKPVVLLVDEGSRSGKELIAHGFRSLGIGPVVGETTAGAVVSGMLNALSDGSLLYVAVADVTVAGARLEGRGVTPDIAVPFDAPYAAGADPQLERAVAVAAERVENRTRQ